MFKKELQAVIKSECGNKDFGTALQFLAVDPVEAECDMVDRACKGFGTNEMLLLSIICGRTNKEIEILKVRSKLVAHLFSCFFPDFALTVTRFCRKSIFN